MDKSFSSKSTNIDLFFFKLNKINFHHFNCINLKERIPKGTKNPHSFLKIKY